MDIGKNLLLEMYHTMTRIRLFEGRVRDLATANEIPGFVHVSIGEEASAAGISAMHVMAGSARDEGRRRAPTPS